MEGKYKVVMIRNGESEWNKKRFFCGWFDSALTSKGCAEAETAGKTLKALGFKFDAGYTSLLRRAQKTLDIILNEIGEPDVPVYKSWRMNERHYGGLTGISLTECAAKYGYPQAQIWLRSYDLPVPPMGEHHLYYSTIMNDPRYVGDPKPGEFPMAESLKQTVDRTLRYWHDVIVPQIKEGKNSIIIAAHGNSLRAIIKHLDGLSEEDILRLNIPTGIPFVYELDENLIPVDSMVFLGDEETVNKAMAEVIVAQAKLKG